MPTTPAGKSISSKNATKHGVLSTSFVLTGTETEEAWQAHLLRYQEDLGPVGPAEEEVEEIAFHTWRKRRARRAEHGASLRRLATAEDRLAASMQARQRDCLVRRPGSPAALRADLRLWHDTAALLETLDTRPEAELLSGPLVTRFFDSLSRAAPDVGLRHIELEELPRHPSWDSLPSLSAGAVRDAVAQFWTEVQAQTPGPYTRMFAGREAFLACARAVIGQREGEVAAEVAAMEEELGHEQDASLLPEAAELATLTRYEAHLSRELGRAFKELRTLQAARHPGSRSSSSSSSNSSSNSNSNSKTPHAAPPTAECETNPSHSNGSSPASHHPEPAYSVPNEGNCPVLVGSGPGEESPEAPTSAAPAHLPCEADAPLRAGGCPHGGRRSGEGSVERSQLNVQASPPLRVGEGLGEGLGEESVERSQRNVQASSPLRVGEGLGEGLACETNPCSATGAEARSVWPVPAPRVPGAGGADCETNSELVITGLGLPSAAQNCETNSGSGTHTPTHPHTHTSPQPLCLPEDSPLARLLPPGMPLAPESYALCYPSAARDAESPPEAATEAEPQDQTAVYIHPSPRYID